MGWWVNLYTDCLCCCISSPFFQRRWCISKVGLKAVGCTVRHPRATTSPALNPQFWLALFLYWFSNRGWSLDSFTRTSWLVHLRETSTNEMLDMVSILDINLSYSFWIWFITSNDIWVALWISYMLLGSMLIYKGVDLELLTIRNTVNSFLKFILNISKVIPFSNDTLFQYFLPLLKSPQPVF